MHDPCFCLVSKDTITAAGCEFNMLQWGEGEKGVLACHGADYPPCYTCFNTS